MSSTQYFYILSIVIPLYVMFTKWQSTKGLRSLPTIGYDFPLLSYISAFRFARHAQEMLSEGYQKYKGKMFKIAMQDRWLVVLTTPEDIEEVRKMSDDKVDFIPAAADLTEIRYTFSPELHNNTFTATIMKSHLTKHLDFLFRETHDETVAAFNDKIGNIGQDWTAVHMLSLARYVVSRASSRVFVGPRLCREPEYIDVAIGHTAEVADTMTMLGWFPGFTRYLAVLFFKDIRKSHTICRRLVEPIVQERLRIYKEVGHNWEDKPRDALQSIIEGCLSKGWGIEVMISTILLFNFVSIHNTSNSLTHALYHIAAQPEHLETLRTEIALVLEKEDLSKNALAKMPKLDSFLRESQRINGSRLIHIFRKAFRPITFSNGVTIPPDTYIGAPLLSIQHDEEFYPDAGTSYPWRYCEKRDDISSSEGMKYQYVSTSPDYLAFGHGKHACPGRFFAANEIKGMFIHIIMNYDIMFESDTGRPQNTHNFIQASPYEDIHMLFKKHQT